ncbi:MAG TPA: response regulator transcription factor [Burkholderiales bacterium]|nr:response regulator transcription factor [Burkholderiales bacterium]
MSPFISPAVPLTQALPSVLLVEEHDEMRSALRDWLLTSFPPLRLREARSMDEALRLAEQAALDLALINLELPGPNGIEATRLMRKRFPACRVVVMSVSESMSLRIAALAAGAEAFVCKRDLRLSLHAIFATLGKPPS